MKEKNKVGVGFLSISLCFLSRHEFCDFLFTSPQLEHSFQHMYPLFCHFANCFGRRFCGDGHVSRGRQGIIVPWKPIEGLKCIVI